MLNLQSKKHKILMLSDHQLSTSGVGTQARWLINGLVETGRYSFRCFGGAVKHDNYDVVTVNEDFIIKPTNGFGDKNILRQVLATEKPDVLLLFTDPRFFIWVWEMEDEIHQICPIAYNHLWDNPPWPEFNRILYESTDLINCINWPTYEMVHERFPEKTNYVPHAVPTDLYRKLSQREIDDARLKLLGPNKVNDFVVLYVSRNARRKMPSDVIISFKMFLDELEKKYGHRNATLLMHTDPFDQEGPNLVHVIEAFGVTKNVLFSNDRIGFPEMNVVYNVSDVVINRSCNEGFGLSILEAKMAEKPCIALKTGGLTKQIVDDDGFEYGIALEPEAKSLVGNQFIPYIYEDFVSHETVANAFMKMYDMPKDERENLGAKAREHALKNYNMNNLIKSWDMSLTKLITDWKNQKEKWCHIEL